MVYCFAKQSGCHATIYSEIGTGTTVNLYLPRANDETSGQPHGEEVQTPRGTGQVVLVVEDDLRVRRLTARRLVELGYEVIEAGIAQEALDTVNDNNLIDLVFTDIVMPGEMTGYELCETLRSTRPALKLLLTSGYAEDLVHADRLASSNLMLLRKPYRQDELGEAVRKALKAD